MFFPCILDHTGQVSLAINPHYKKWIKSFSCEHCLAKRICQEEIVRAHWPRFFGLMCYRNGKNFKKRIGKYQVAKVKSTEVFLPDLRIAPVAGFVSSVNGDKYCEFIHHPLPFEKTHHSKSEHAKFVVRYRIIINGKESDLVETKGRDILTEAQERLLEGDKVTLYRSIGDGEEIKMNIRKELNLSERKVYSFRSKVKKKKEA